MGTRNMAERDNRFYIANIAAATLLVNGIGALSKPAPECDDKKSECPLACVTGPHRINHVSGVLAVAGSVALMDRLPFAGVFGILASILPYTHEETRNKTCHFSALVAVASCAYLFMEKRMSTKNWFVPAKQNEDV